ncbi:cell division protein FtsY [Corynebacterium xerosis]|uniref:signal recognition particle-docking protein FtsY n=1 Tax=Corynebacterium xerosis TaxID=1725 RepID=UPI000627F00A|nr:signal recognition particle-docking protein FtsY [Corynebacterium xerosis]KKO81492.1 cell division protein FtsY [Corynebacterium xerosis]SQB95653.1 signal recognition particle-docking protein FtsY [Clostridium paraputrificum]
MTVTQWIILAAVVVVLLLVILLLVGLARRKKNTISFEEKKAPEELTQAEKSGNYQATGGFNFAPAAPAPTKKPEKQPDLLPGQELGATPPAPPAPPVPPAPVAEPEPEVEPQPQPEPEPEPAPEPEPVETEIIELDPEAPAEPETPVESVEAVEDMEAPEVPEELADEPALPEVEDLDEPAPDVVPPADLAPEPVAEAPEDTDADAGVVREPVAETATVDDRPAEVDDVATEAVAPVVPEQKLDDIDPADGRISRLRGRLSRSQNAIGQSVLGILGAGDLDEDAWEEIEDTLIMADLGTAATMNVVEKLRERIASRGVSSEAQARALLREVLIEECGPEMDRSIRALPHEGKPAVVLVVGVNGTGKTTTTGKLARVLVAQGHDVLLGAADTFRAAAADQLETWGRRVGATTVRGPEGADPASIAFDAVAKGIDAGSDVVLIDTAGRLHTKTGLMDQLGKVKRVVEKKAAVDEVLLVLDATVGQNGLIQARTFRDVVDITGVVLTKLDGTAKGGIVFQVQRELGVPVKLVGLGEGADHLAPFEPEGFVDALLG